MDCFVSAADNLHSSYEFTGSAQASGSDIYMRQSTKTTVRDFGADGISIQTAMVRHVQSHPDRVTRPKYILWNGKVLRTTYEIAVQKTGAFELEFLSQARYPLQGVDVSVDEGEISLTRGGRVGTLRTWHDPRYEETVKYPFRAKNGLLRVWNVYQCALPSGEIVDEKWTGNAGFIVEQESERQWLFHCSCGPCTPPDFDQLIFRLSILEH